MKKFDFTTLCGDPRLKFLVAVYYQQDEIRPISEYEVVMGKQVAITDPYTGRIALLDESAETRDEDGNWIATVYMTEGIYTPRTLAEKLVGLKPGEEIHFITNSRSDGYSVRRLSVFNADLFIARRWDCELSMYDARGTLMDPHDIDMWICDITGLNPDENIYQADEQTRMEANHNWFDHAYGLVNLRCDREGWFISDAGSHYRIEADDDKRNVCADDDEARRRAIALGIRFSENNPYCPADLIYPHKSAK
jgi:hypothetical protein